MGTMNDEGTTHNIAPQKNNPSPPTPKNTLTSNTGSNGPAAALCASLACADLRAERSPSASRRHFCSLTAAARA